MRALPNRDIASNYQQRSPIPRRRIGKDLKESALRLWELGWDADDISLALGISRSGLYRWDAIFDELGDVNRPPSPLCGRTRILTRALLTVYEELFVAESDLYLDEVVTWLALVHGIRVSTSTLSRGLLEAGLTRKMLQKLAVERDEEQRHQWMEEWTVFDHYMHVCIH